MYLILLFGQEDDIMSCMAALMMIMQRSMVPWGKFNIDYKIATKAIANRLKRVLPSTISNEQTGFIKGRYICSVII